jgi:hypothetical protein
VAPKVVHTRERMIMRFKDGTFVYPGALFRLTPEELAASTEQRHGRSGWVSPVNGEDGQGGEDDGTGPEDGDESDADFADDPGERRAA